MTATPALAFPALPPCLTPQEYAPLHRAYVLAAAVKLIRIAGELPAQQVAEALGVSLKSLDRYIRDRPDCGLVRKIAPCKHGRTGHHHSEHLIYAKAP